MLVLTKARASGGTQPCSKQAFKLFEHTTPPTPCVSLLSLPVSNLKHRDEG